MNMAVAMRLIAEISSIYKIHYHSYCDCKKIKHVAVVYDKVFTLVGNLF